MGMRSAGFQPYDARTRGTVTTAIGPENPTRSA